MSGSLRDIGSGGRESDLTGPRLLVVLRSESVQVKAGETTPASEGFRVYL